MTDVIPVSAQPTIIEPSIGRSSLTVETVTPQAVPITTDAVDKSSESNWGPIPTVASESLSRKFEVDLPNIEITCLDMTAHGCFVLAGCSNGMVLLFDLTSSSK
jgi:hypothetical protein